MFLVPNVVIQLCNINQQSVHFVRFHYLTDMLSWGGGSRTLRSYML